MILQIVSVIALACVLLAPLGAWAADEARKDLAERARDRARNAATRSGKPQIKAPLVRHPKTTALVALAVAALLYLTR